MKKDRLNTISDGIFAIIITIMILGIKIPELVVANIPVILQSVFIYLISFVLIAILWINHHHLFNHREYISIKLVWFNFMLMFITSFIPVATERINEDFFHPSTHIFYSIVLGTSTLIYTLIHHYSMKELKRPLDDASNIVNWLATILFFVGIPLSFISVYLSSIIFIAIPIYYLYHTFNPFKID